MSPLLTLLAVLGAAAQDPVEPLLAPTPAALRASMVRTGRLLDQGDALATATARAQNAVLVGIDAAVECEAGRDQQALRAELLGEAWWARVQSARAEFARAQRLAAAPAAQPLLRQTDTEALSALRQRLDDQARSFLVAARAQQARILPYRERCPATLIPGPGLPPPAPTTAEEQSRGVAVLLIAGGLLCPDPQGTDAPVAVAEDAAVVLGTAAACWSAVECDCAPVQALPGAVFGPPSVVEPAEAP